MRSLWVAAAAVTFAAAAAAEARADVLRATLGQPLREVSHSVDVTVADGVATYKVRRVFANPGDVADEAGLAIDLPFGAAATGLRIRARDRWYDAELMEREKAAKLYQELTGHGAFAPKDPALLQWLWADKLYLQVFPVLPGAASTVEYTLTVPTRYQGGKIFLSYPRLAAASDPGADTDDAPPPDSRPLAAPVITIQPSWGDATTRIVVDGLRVTPGAPVVLDAPVTPSWYDAVGGTSDASYVASTLTVPESPAVKQKTFAKATVVLAISHTYRSDLRVDLITPKGERCPVFDGAGGGENDVKGKFPLKLPPGTPGAGTWQLVVSDHAALDVGTIDGWSLELGDGAAAVKTAASDVPVFIPDAPESATEAGVASIEIAPPKIDVVAARLGKVIASPQHGFARLELDLAPELKPLPAGARVVFVLDGSHSIGPRGIDVQLAMIRGYLAHVPDATAEIVVYRRTATRLFGSFVAAPDVPAKIAAAKAAGKLDPGNGSALDLGAELATSLLASAGAGGKTPLRVVITTDELLRNSFTPKLAIAALAKLPPSAIVHVVLPDTGDDEELSLARDDKDDFAPIASAHHGIFAHFDGVSGKPDKDVAGRALALVRPMQLDYAKVDGVEIDRDGQDLDGSAAAVLREGEGVRQVQATATPPATVTISGKIWSDPFRRVVAVDAGFARAAAGWVFSEDDYHDLSDAEQMKVAMSGRAVSPVTSYLAVEPGTRPSTIGIPMEARGTIGHGSGMGSGYGVGFGRARVPPDLMSLVSEAAEKCVAQFKPPSGWSVTLMAETTLDEVVDVGISAGDKQPIAKCLVEAVWAVRLTSDFDADHDSFQLDFH